MNFQMFKLDLQKAEEPEVKLPASSGSWKKQESSRKTSTSVSLNVPKPLTVWITTNCGKFLELGIPDHLTCLLRNLCTGQEATASTEHGITAWFQIRKLTSLFLVYDSVHFSSVAQLCPTLCDPMYCSTPGFPVHHQLLSSVQFSRSVVSDSL